MGSIDIGDDGEENGKVLACHPNESLSQTRERRRRLSPSSNTDVSDLGLDFVLSPGLIDVHTHISALGRNWEGYTTATKAAAAGGITTIMGMPLNSIPSTTTLEAVELEKGQASTHSEMFVDVGLWGGVVPENLESVDILKSLIDSPYIFGLKAFLAPLPPAAGYQAVTPAQLIEAARICGTRSLRKKPILVHSELMTEEESLQQADKAFEQVESDVQSYQGHLQSRSAKWEQDAVRVVCQAAESCQMHVVHLSDARGCLPIIKEWKRNNSTLSSSLTVETCPHYLLLDETKIHRGETRVKCFPPIRDRVNRKMLWEGLTKKDSKGNSLIDMIASDHSPCEPYMRHMETGDFRTSWGGLSGLQYQIQATWTAFCEESQNSDEDNLHSSLLEMSRWWSSNPAKLAGVSSKKGVIAPGYYADLCWWDPLHKGAPNEYSREYHRWAGTTFFADNTSMRGRVLGTWLKGRKVYDGLEDEHKTETFGRLMTFSHG